MNVENEASEIDIIKSKVKALYEVYLNMPWCYEVKTEEGHWRMAEYGSGLDEDDGYVFPDTIDPNIPWFQELTGDYDCYHQAECYADEFEGIYMEVIPPPNCDGDEAYEEWFTRMLDVKEDILEWCKEWPNKLKTALGV